MYAVLILYKKYHEAKKEHRDRYLECQENREVERKGNET